MYVGQLLQGTHRYREIRMGRNNLLCVDGCNSIYETNRYKRVENLQCYPGQAKNANRPALSQEFELNILNKLRVVARMHHVLSSKFEERNCRYRSGDSRFNEPSNRILAPTICFAR